VEENVRAADLPPFSQTEMEAAIEIYNAHFRDQVEAKW
jgi:hypothetical protein